MGSGSYLSSVSSLGIEETVRFVEEFVAKKLQLRF